ncbi:MAG: hypothetical protein JRI22_09040 [Deltaproteobacteria bacterium]|nr:hypothetical protein [Deltaproteobacteria bacterium]
MESWVTIIVTAVAALGSIITALIGWAAKKGVNYLDEKTKVLDEASEIERKEAIKKRIVDTVTLVTRATMQTYVDEVKAKNEDGKLTKAEAAEALRRTVDKSLQILKRDGIEVGRDVLEIVVEAVVGKIKDDKKGGLKEAA